MVAQYLLDVLRLVVDRRAEHVANLPLGELSPQIEDLVIPTDDAQDASSEGPRVSFAMYALVCV
jgi:hypothetical protein